MIEEREKTVTFPHSSLEVDQRLDKFLSDHEDIDLSRACIQSLIRDGAVTVNGDKKKPSYQLKPGDVITIRYMPREMVLVPSEEVEFELLYEDDSILVVNKPPGLVVHPSAGHTTGTLVHGLLHRCADLSSLGGPTRPGIVHRLDKDTSGLLVVAKEDRAHRFLADQFKKREVIKQYVALVHGCIGQARGRIDLPISRHPMKRTEMYASLSRGREAVTEWERVSVFPLGFSLLRVSLHTGRTHQIRVHMAHMGYPVVGDSVYGYGKRWWKKQPPLVKEFHVLVKRQMLHAELLGFRHPDSLKYRTFEAPPPADMALLLQYLNEDRNQRQKIRDQTP